jgi:hypothetical protein
MVPVWHQGDSALQVALDRAASSFGMERIPVEEAAGVLRSLAGESIQLLTLVARAKLEDHGRRGYGEQVAEMHAAAALLLASSVQYRPSDAPAAVTQAGAQPA